jgi:hypothetical protein
MTLGRRTFVMTDPQAAEKAFQARRAGLAPADPAADEAYVKLLRILSPARPREQWFMRTVRKLSDAEAAAYIAGRPLGAEVVRLDVWAAWRRKPPSTALTACGGPSAPSRKRLACGARRGGSTIHDLCAGLPVGGAGRELRPK